MLLKVVILAGGFGTRIGEETDIRPKPMIEIGGHPILWHIMKSYSHYGFKDFIILLGYKGFHIKQFFVDYYMFNSDIAIDMSNNSMDVLNNKAEDWKVTLIDTGLETQTGGRVLRAKPYIGDETFMLTYGDGVSDINIEALVDFHKQHNKLLTMTSVQPEGRFGAIDFDSDGAVKEFREKPPGDNTWINAGYMVCDPGIFDYLGSGDQTVLEREPMENMAKMGQVMAYRHSGFWKCMDTTRDKRLLNGLWDSGQAKWCSWL
ncbi:glucose-1-phosphate cytidylyltransferase [Oleiphilus messinensis]|uniref:Glucose-1-phosphate cytidylyltransferase n=1 Tax=Oleiphilus messinensis TaxID=141451 RepID=A0A1Y0I690_9GAMM|nr:glucose-1-phosphate cytidylyltransferase [Oleiphilus messinensis]ARU56008.1 glucose-1-phosphate cytidylyltransferase [Oleiphilus messinensis]